MIDPYGAAALLAQALKVVARCGLLPTRDSADMSTHARIRHRTLDYLFDRLAARLAVSRTGEHHDIAAALADAVEAKDYRGALALAATAGHHADLRAEKIVSRKYRFLWICNPKVASRSIIAALRAADPGARLIRKRTLDEVLARHPEVRDYFSFAFVRHPCGRAHSCHADKHGLALHDRAARRWFIEPYYGLRVGMSFDEFCRWLATPCGSDAFADRHWLSQHRQIRTAEGRLPDFIGHFESLDADWRTVADRLGLPCRDLPRLNVRPEKPSVEEHPDAATVALLEQRYAEDFRVGGYDRTRDGFLPRRSPAPLTDADAAAPAAMQEHG